MKYILSIGTNIGNRKENIEKACEALDLIPETRVLRCSSVYETEPVGYAEQDSFYNICVEVESGFEPNEMLGVCLGIEAGLGRVRSFKNAPRIIDIDIILFDGGEVNSKNLTVPHPRFTERRFVLIPLLELFPSGEAYSYEFKKHLLGIKGQAVIQI